MPDQESEDFEGQLRDCLIHLYDYAFLQAQPLVRKLVPHASGEASRVQLFRQIIFDAIEQLKPAADPNSQSAQARTWRILTLRYVKQQSTALILRQLSLSERQFYRDHIKAMQTLGQILSDQVSPLSLASTDPSMSIQSEIDRVHGWGNTSSIAVTDFLNKVVSALHGLIARYPVEVLVQSTDGLLPGTIDQTVLRQTILWILSQLVIHVTEPGQIILSCQFQRAHYQFHFVLIGWSSMSSADTLLDRVLNGDQATLDSLIHALNGRLFEEDTHSGAAIVLEIPFKQHSLLIVDDNPDAITLFRRYLVGQPYRLSAAYNGQQAVSQAQLLQPAVIVLDVMIPQQDGWEILQTLKTHPETRRIPVLICSVLNTPDLALSLGADGFLRKPPGESDFLRVLSLFIDPQPESP